MTELQASRLADKIYADHKNGTLGRAGAVHALSLLEPYMTSAQLNEFSDFRLTCGVGPIQFSSYFDDRS